MTKNSVLNFTLTGAKFHWWVFSLFLQLLFEVMWPKSIWLKSELLLGTNPGFTVLTAIDSPWLLRIWWDRWQCIHLRNCASTFVFSLLLISCWSQISLAGGLNDPLDIQVATKSSFGVFVTWAGSLKYAALSHFGRQHWSAMVNLKLKQNCAMIQCPGNSLSGKIKE